MAGLKTLLLLSAIVGISYGAAYGDNSVVAEFDVQCDDTHFAVFFNKTALDERTVSGYNNRSYIIKFYGQSSTACWTHDYESGKVANTFSGLTSSSTFSSTIYLGVPLAATPSAQCGINVFEDPTHIIYNTTIVITYGQNPNNMIGREEYDKYNVMCLRNRTVEEQLNGNVNVDYRKTGYDADNATQDFDFALVHSDMNGAVPTGNRYQLGDFIKFKLELKSARTEVKSVIQRCWATSDGSANEYALITNRCDMEEGTQWVVQPNNTFHIFRTEAFRYLNVMTDAVHLECLVRVCLANSPDADCVSCLFSGRKRREVTEEASSSTAGTMSVVRSPIFYIIDRESTSTSNEQQSSGGALSGTNGLIVIILLSTLVFVIAAAIIKKVFFAAPAAPVAVTAYQNKAMA